MNDNIDTRFFFFFFFDFFVFLCSELASDSLCSLRAISSAFLFCGLAVAEALAEASRWVVDVALGVILGGFA